MAKLDANLSSNEILLVDDDSATLKALSRLLESEQYVVRTAKTGQDAIKQIELAQPYIVLLDLGLPDADGVDLLRKFLRKGVSHVIIVSGTDNADTTRSCLRAGAFDFLIKPAAREELLQAIRRASSAYDVDILSSQQYPLQLHPGFGALETPSDASQKLFKQIKQFRTSSTANSLITGPAGLLKRDVAALVHHYNERTGSALLINCALETDDDALARFTQTAHSSSYTKQTVYARHAIAQLNELLHCEKSLSSEFLSFLTDQSWDGNLVELKNRLLIAYRATEDGEEIVYDSQLWPPMIHETLTHNSHDTGVACAIGMSLEDAENRLIRATLDSVNGNKRQAAQMLGISVKTLYNRLKR